MNNTIRNKNGNVILEIKEDGLSAWLTIKKTGKMIDENDILNLMEEAGIKYGYEDALKWLQDNDFQKDYNEPFPIAICKPQSTEARIHYYFEHQERYDFQIGGEGASMTPAIIDMNTLSNWNYVSPGFVLAEYSYNLFDDNSSVYNIFGEMIALPEHDPAELSRLAGPNVHYDEKSHRFISKATGYPYLDKDGRISLLNHLIIDHPADGSVLKTPLSIKIIGDVNRCQFAVLGNLDISGSVLASSIHCEGDLTVGGNIELCESEAVHAIGNVSCNSILSSRLISAGKLFLKSHIENSTVICEHGIQGDPDQSWALNGYLQACGDITLGAAGSKDQDPLEIEITIGPYYKAMLMHKTKELIALKQFSNTRAETLADLENEIHTLESKLDNELDLFLKRDRNSKHRIVITGDVYPKTFFRILKHSYPIKRHQRGLELTEQD